VCGRGSGCEVVWGCVLATVVGRSLEEQAQGYVVVYGVQVYTCVHISVGVVWGWCAYWCGSMWCVCGCVCLMLACVCGVDGCVWGGVYRVSVSEQRAGCGLAACGVSE
jgi:hypothetical protein